METHQATKPLRQARCDCGALAVRKKSTGFVCANCDRIESIMYGGHGTRTGGFDFALQATNAWIAAHKYIKQYHVHTPQNWIEPDGTLGNI